MITEEEIKYKAFCIWQCKERLHIKSTPDQNWFEAKQELEVLENLTSRRYYGWSYE